MEFPILQIVPKTGGQKIYKVPYAGIIRQVQRVGCLIPLSFLKLPDFRLSRKLYYTNYLITMIKLPKNQSFALSFFAGLLMSSRIKIATAFTPRLRGYTAMMLVKDLKCSKTV